MCPEHLKKVLNENIANGDPVDIIIPVHLYGKACSQKIFDIAEQYGVWTIEDACESTFAPNIGKGHVLTTSFFSNHLISAGGGGVIMTNHDDIDEYCWKLINHGRSSRFGNEDIHKIAEKFHFDKWGHSMKWNDVSAAIDKAQIERQAELYGARDDNASVLFSYLWGWQADYKKIILPDERDHTFMMYPIVLQDPDMDAQNIIRDLNDSGIEVRRMMPITNQPIVQEYFGGNLEQEFPNAHFINQQGFYVGVHPELSEDDMIEMGEIIHNVLKKECVRLDPKFVAPYEVSDDSR
jgi:dTDP-4-amino-4,6-dideoxygalactose transaminase